MIDKGYSLDQQEAKNNSESTLVSRLTVKKVWKSVHSKKQVLLKYSLFFLAHMMSEYCNLL